MLLEDTTESYARVPVRTDSSEPRRIFVINAPRPVAGDIWHMTAEIHVTNDDLRERGHGVACVTEARIQDHTTNDRSGGFIWLRANGFGNVGVEAHHALISRSKWIEWTQELVDDLPGGPDTQLYLKFFVMAQSTRARSRDQLIITPGRGFLQLRIEKASTASSLA
jgi:hypothetical protein